MVSFLLDQFFYTTSWDSTVKASGLRWISLRWLGQRDRKEPDAIGHCRCSPVLAPSTRYYRQQ